MEKIKLIELMSKPNIAKNVKSESFEFQRNTRRLRYKFSKSLQVSEPDNLILRLGLMGLKSGCEYA